MVPAEDEGLEVNDGTEAGDLLGWILERKAKKWGAFSGSPVRSLIF